MAWLERNFRLDGWPMSWFIKYRYAPRERDRRKFSIKMFRRRK